VPITGTSPSAQALQLQIQRAMPGEQRPLLALKMSLFARELAKKRIRLGRYDCRPSHVFGLGQGDLRQPLKPAPEHDQLGGLVGNWTSEGAWIDSPFSPAETQSLTIKCTWLPGGFAIERHLDGMKILSGEDHELQVLTYDPMAKEYLSHWFDNHGGSGVHRVSISDNVLTATSVVMAQGKSYQIRAP
jgi:hypothetical protein